MCSTNARKQGHTNIEYLDKTFFYEFTAHNKEFDITTAKNQCVSEQAVVVQQKKQLQKCMQYHHNLFCPATHHG